MKRSEITTKIGGTTMVNHLKETKIIKKVFVVALIVILTAFVTYCVTMLNLSIETDGDGDSAIVTVFGQSDMYGINGYTID